MWSSCNSHTLLMGMQFGTTTLGKALAIFMKLNICLFFDSNSIPKYLSKRSESICRQKHLTKMFIELYL